MDKIGDDQFGARLRDERRRLGLNQTEFAKLGGAALPSQTRYEAGTQLPKADYLIGLGQRGIDVLYVVTGQRNEAASGGGEASELLTAFYSLPPQMKRTATKIVSVLAAESRSEQHPTLHDDRIDYRSE